MGHDPVDDTPVCSTETRLIFRGIWKVHLSVTYPDSDFSAYHRQGGILLHGARHVVPCASGSPTTRISVVDSENLKAVRDTELNVTEQQGMHR
jgi:hypothetical protein